MASPSFSILYHAKVSGSSSTGSAGDPLIPSTAGSTFVLASAANRGTRRTTGIALGSYSPNETVEIQQLGQVDWSTFNLGAGTASWVRVSNAGALERAATPSSGDDVVGWCDTDGTVHLACGFLTAEMANATSSSSPVLTTPQINDTSSDHQYVFAVSELAADRTVTLPLLTGNDEFVFKDHTQTLTNKTYRTVVTAMGALAIDWSLGNVFTKTLAAGGNTLTFSNDTDGQVITVILTSDALGSTVTWPAGVQWAGGTEPTQSTPAKTDVYTLIKAGGTIRGSYVQDFS